MRQLFVVCLCACLLVLVAGWLVGLLALLHAWEGDDDYQFPFSCSPSRPPPSLSLS
jgi:hypothetical protein